MHVDQPACFLSRFFHPVKSETCVHLVGELAALQPLEGGHRGSIISVKTSVQPHWVHAKYLTNFQVSFTDGASQMKELLTGFPDLLHFVLGPLWTFRCFAEPYCLLVPVYNTEKLTEVSSVKRHVKLFWSSFKMPVLRFSLSPSLTPLLFSYFGAFLQQLPREQLREEEEQRSFI